MHQAASIRLKTERDEWEEHGGGLGIGGEDVKMTLNVLVVQMRDKEDQLREANARMKQTGASPEEITRLQTEQQKLKDEMRELRTQMDAAQARNRNAGAFGGAQPALVTQPSFGDSGSSNTSMIPMVPLGGARAEFGPVQARKKNIE